jgi:hypothetical protein
MTEQLTEERTSSDVVVAPEGPVRVAWAPVPKVNLLPIEIVEGRRFRRTQLLLGGAIVAVGLAAAGGTFWAQQGIDDAHDQLTTAQAQVGSLEAEQAKYAAVPKVLAEVEAANSARTLAMGSDVLWSGYLNDIKTDQPDGVTLSGFTITMNGGGASAGASNPLIPVGVGSISMGGSAERYDEIASWLEAINKITGFSASSMVSATHADTGDSVTFSATAVVDSDALSDRYNKKAG